MEWNNGSEWRKFQREQEKLRKEYLAAGMTEEQCNSMYEYDLDRYKKRRIEAMHTQRLDIETGDDEDRNKDNPLYKKFLEKIAVEDKHINYSRYGWVEDIDDVDLYHAIDKLSKEDIELLTRYAIYGMKQKQIAEVYGVSQQAISKRIKKIERNLKKWL